jgi:tetratricopeptide (TPR) repeat protein
VDKYTQAVQEGGPPAYAAVLYCNRAAAQQSLGNLLEAIADCGRARALNPTYIKATTRLASMLLDIRRPAAAAEAYDALLAKGDLAAAEARDMKGKADAARAQAKWQKTAEHYKTLGLARSCRWGAAWCVGGDVAAAVLGVQMVAGPGLTGDGRG